MTSRDYRGYREIRTRLARLRSWWRLTHLTEGALIFVAATLGVLLVAVLAERWLHFESAGRHVLRLVWLFTALATLALFIVRRAAQSRTDEELALLAEARYPEVHNYLINSVRLAKDEVVASPALVDAAIEETRQKVGPVRLTGAVSLRGLRRFSLLTVMLLAGGGMLFVLSPAMRNACARVLQPGANILQLGNVVITSVTPGRNVTLVEGGSLSVAAEIKPVPGEISGELQYRNARGGEWKDVRMRRTSETAFQAELREVREAGEYRLRIGDSRTPHYLINIVENPAVNRIDATYAFPAYTHLPDKPVENCDGTIRALAGTKVSLRFLANKKIGNGALRLNDVEQSLKVNADQVSLETLQPIEVKTEGAYTVLLTDTGGYAGRDPVARAIHVEPDKKPVVQIAAPGRDLVLNAGATLSLAVRGSDDYGIARGELVVRRKGAEQEDVVHTWDGADSANVTFAWDWPLDAKAYPVGTVLRYYVRMSDNNNVTGPGVGRSAEFQLSIEDLEAKAEAMKKKYNDWHLRLEKVLSDQRVLRRETETLGGGAPAKEGGAP